MLEKGRLVSIQKDNLSFYLKERVNEIDCLSINNITNYCSKKNAVAVFLFINSQNGRYKCSAYMPIFGNERIYDQHAIIFDDIENCIFLGSFAVSEFKAIEDEQLLLTAKNLALRVGYWREEYALLVFLKDKIDKKNKFVKKINKNTLKKKKTVDLLIEQTTDNAEIKGTEKNNKKVILKIKSNRSDNNKDTAKFINDEISGCMPDYLYQKYKKLQQEDKLFPVGLKGIFTIKPIFKTIIMSKFFISAIVLSAFVTVILLFFSEKHIFYIDMFNDLIISTIPALLGLSLAGFAVVVSHSNEYSLYRMADLDIEKNDEYSLYQKFNATFSITVLSQLTPLIITILVRIIKPISIGFPVSSLMANIGNSVVLFLTLLFLFYALFSIIELVRNIFNLGQSVNSVVFKKHNEERQKPREV